MFGARTMIRSHYEDKKNSKPIKSKTHVKLFRSAAIKQHKKLDSNGMVLFAMLSGGDYDQDGLEGCGPKTALKAAQSGLGRRLCEAEKSGPPALRRWGQELQDFLISNNCSVQVPADFPSAKTLKKYTTPCVSPPDKLNNLNGLKDRWKGRPIDEVKLRSFLRTRFNMQTNLYLRHVAPILLARTLSVTSQGQEASNKIYGVELVLNKRKEQSADPEPTPLMTKITLLPRSVTNFDISTQPEGPEGEDWSTLGTKPSGPFDPYARIECELLCWTLQRGVPEIFRIPVELPPAQEKEKKKRVRKTEAEASVGASESTQGVKALKKRKSPDAGTTIEPSKQGNKRKAGSSELPVGETGGERTVSTPSTQGSSSVLPNPVKKTFKMPAAIPLSVSSPNVVNMQATKVSSTSPRGLQHCQKGEQ